ncbi:uncharacterized protein LOC143628891 [Bidens hawaiensis]|uniref:uncharacterized protein LOC143628891 n=1 Tax=Bidens hawaiensis TaxID=980011 RepID=UPI00404B1218
MVPTIENQANVHVGSPPPSQWSSKRANRSMVEGIKARLGREKGSWVEELPHVLWAHRTMPKMSNGETLFSLTYETEAMIPAEIGVPTRRTLQRERGDEVDLRLNLNLEEERREVAARDVVYKKNIERYYNARVGEVKFKAGDLVLRENEASRKEDQGKLSPKWERPYQVIWAGDKGAYRLADLAGKEVPRTWNSTQLRKYYA